MTEGATIFLVDDDASVLNALSRLLRTAGFRVEPYGSPTEFLEAHQMDQPGCAVLDVAMPELNGLDLQRALSTENYQRPVIFVTGGSDIATGVHAMKAGAVDFLTKPVGDMELIGAIQTAIEKDLAIRRHLAELREARERYDTLTKREKEVLFHVVAGRLNKQIAGDLGTVEKTIKVHRARVMEKMGARSVPELVRFAELLDNSKR